MDEKERRRKQDKNSKREFSSCVASTNDKFSDSLKKRNLDNYKTFEDWAVKQMALKRAESVAECEKLWRLELAKPEVNKIFERGTIDLSLFQCPACFIC